jgi:uncharacterized RDD family membrane protein YckC
MAAGASDRVLDFVDPNQVLDHVDVNTLLDRVEVNDLLDRVDVDTLLDRVDVNRLLDRVDVDALLERADVNALMDRVDVQKLVDRAGIPDIVADSTSHLTGSALDFFRRPIVGLDEIIFRALNRMVGRDPQAAPQGPGDLVAWVEEQTEAQTRVKTGRYAGPLTRLLAVVVDTLVVTLGFTLIVGGFTFLVQLFVSSDFELPEASGIVYGVSLAVWAFLYLSTSLTIWGKTIGKALLGVRVVGADGSLALQGRKPLIRVLTYPLSFLFFGLGLLGVVFNPQRQAWHDRLAGTAVVYDWGSRTAVMPTPLADFLERRGAGV